MKLPRKGLLVDPMSGSILWAWEHNDPTREFDSLPPIISRSDGIPGPVATPDAVVIDCEMEFDIGDIPSLYQNLANVRAWKNPQQRWEFFLLIKGQDAQGNDITLEVPHPIEAIREARKKAREPKP